MVDAIHEILGRADVKASRLRHGGGELTWILMEGRNALRQLRAKSLFGN